MEKKGQAARIRQGRQSCQLTNRGLRQSLACDVKTYCIGQCASMGAVLLAALLIVRRVRAHNQ